MEELNIVDKILLFISAICIIVALAAIPYCIYNHYNKDNYCNCTVDFNGQQTSIEDVLNMMMEGLSYDQADEVQIMINNSLNSIVR